MHRLLFALVLLLVACGPQRQVDLPPSGGTDGGSECENPCDEGDSRCQGNGVQSCDRAPNGCLVWSSAVSCNSNQICNSGRCQAATCQNQCTTVGALRCSGSDVQECSRGEGCLVWATVATCNTNQVCQGGLCRAGSCSDACGPEGTGRCQGNSIQLCQRTSSGCLDWTLPQACPAGRPCTNNACAQSCTNACSPVGAAQCSGNGVRTCVELNGCLTWSAVQGCGPNQTCNGSTNSCQSTGGTQTTIGAACTADAQCTAGTHPGCEAEWPGGYCLSSSCTRDADCGSGGICIMNLFSNGAFCMANCTSDADCRPGYFCGAYNSQAFCFPKCTAATDCGAGNVCNVSTGVCEAAPMNGYPASFPAPPQVINSGGPVLASMKIVPIFFNNEDASLKGSLTDFLSRVGASTFWQAASEYGVGRATSLSAVTVNERAPTSVDDTVQSTSAIWTFLQSKVDASTIPAPDGSTLYVLVYPAGTSITALSQQGCVDFYGYHSQARLAAGWVPYAVIPRCSPFTGLTQLATLTTSMSHELLEAATNPYPFTSPAFGDVDTAHAYFAGMQGGGELGDMCVVQQDANNQFSDLPYVVQRFWSNRAAAAGQDPCVPSLGNVYFNAVPEMSDTITYPSRTGNIQVTGVKVGVGQTKTIKLKLYSSAATSSVFNVGVEDDSQVRGGAQHLQMSVSPATGVNGDEVTLTIKPLQAGAGNVDVFWVITQLGADIHYWFGVVGEQ